MKPLDRFLERYGKPPVEQIEAAGARVWRSVESGDVPRLEETHPADARRPHAWRWPAVATIAAAIALAVLIPATVVRSAPAVFEDGNGSRGIHYGEAVSTSGGAGGTLKFQNGSRVEMRSDSELSIERADNGTQIRIHRGDVIVDAAEPMAVQTKDVSAVGKSLMVNVRESGSRISVIGGDAVVQQGATERKLLRGDHMTTSPKMESLSVKENNGWPLGAAIQLALLQQPVVSAAPTPADAGKPRFEEAAIRPCTSEQVRVPRDLPGGARAGGGIRTVTITPGRFDAKCMTVAQLIRLAHGALEGWGNRSNARGLQFGRTPSYGVEGNRNTFEDLRGAPEWALIDGYTIEAITDASNDAGTIQHVLLQELLERRFQVKTHDVVEQVPAMALTIGKNGLKLKPTQAGDCQTEATDFKSSKPRCSSMLGGFNGANWRWELGGQQLRSIGAGAQHALGIPVLDKTGVTDSFSLIWEYGPDETTPGALAACVRSPEEPSPPCAGRPTAPPLFTVLDQFGLKLEPTMMPRAFIVIDRVERPSPN
jgi:uncharacterized protein (TIGR03435 family)